MIGTLSNDRGPVQCRPAASNPVLPAARQQNRWEAGLKVAERTNIHTREQILRVSSRLFTERGYRATSTRDIADGVGIRQPSLFHHFSSKAEIMAELQQVEFEPAVRILDAARSLPGSASARLFCALFLDFRRLLLLPYNLGATTTAEVLNEPALAD
ncbi:MAG: helix-turn-helix transcriptional regulator, partial [Acidimicrobiaceae bacterium]|nr:helix-turn-helix transcriptional regulator [Acidimicrobiaceae bacterium]